MNWSVIDSDSSCAAAFAIDCPPLLKPFVMEGMSHPRTPVTLGRYATAIKLPLHVPNEWYAQKLAPLGKLEVITKYTPSESGAPVPSDAHT
jgi:hypothetical protein